MISFARPRDAAAVCAFFNVLPFVLPCKFCRQSLSAYYEADPPECAVREGRMGRWLWRIHNAVNAKLRKQGLPTTAADPTFAKVREIYTARLAAGCTRTHFEGWEFLFSVAECHPLGRQERQSTPIPGHPPLEELATASPLERNKWGVMLPEERLPYFEAFWKLLPAALPFPEWEAAWRRAAGKALPSASCRTDCLRGVWGIRRALEEDLQLLNKTTYDSLCKELRDVRSGCGKAAGARRKTCRRKRDSHK